MSMELFPITLFDQLLSSLIHESQNPGFIMRKEYQIPFLFKYFMKWSPLPIVLCEIISDYVSIHLLVKVVYLNLNINEDLPIEYLPTTFQTLVVTLNFTGPSYSGSLTLNLTLACRTPELDFNVRLFNKWSYRSIDKNVLSYHFISNEHEDGKGQKDQNNILIENSDNVETSVLGELIDKHVFSPEEDLNPNIVLGLPYLDRKLQCVIRVNMPLLHEYSQLSYTLVSLFKMALWKAKQEKEKEEENLNV